MTDSWVACKDDILSVSQRAELVSVTSSWIVGDSLADHHRGIDIPRAFRGPRCNKEKWIRPFFCLFRAPPHPSLMREVNDASTNDLENISRRFELKEQVLNLKSAKAAWRRYDAERSYQPCSK